MSDDNLVIIPGTSHQFSGTEVMALLRKHAHINEREAAEIVSSAGWVEELKSAREIFSAPSQKAQQLFIPLEIVINAIV